MQEEKAGISEMALVKVSAEGSEKATRGGVNASQSKFLNGTWHMSQNQYNVPLF
jgi:hypothetical protein